MLWQLLLLHSLVTEFIDYFNQKVNFLLTANHQLAHECMPATWISTNEIQCTSYLNPDDYT